MSPLLLQPQSPHTFRSCGCHKSLLPPLSLPSRRNQESKSLPFDPSCHTPRFNFEVAVLPAIPSHSAGFAARKQSQAPHPASEVAVPPRLVEEPSSPSCDRKRARCSFMSPVLPASLLLQPLQKGARACGFRFRISRIGFGLKYSGFLHLDRCFLLCFI